MTPNLPRLADGFMMRAAYQPNTTELDEIGALRVAAWTPVFGAEAFGGATKWLDEWDTRALHFTVHETSSGSVCAAARLTVHHDLAADPPPDFEDWSALLPGATGLPLGYLSRLVVDPHRRRLGFAKALDAARCSVADNIGAKAVAVTVFAEREREREREREDAGSHFKRLSSFGSAHPSFGRFRLSRGIRSSC